MICSKEKCTGCFACYNICPKNAIEMIEDENGFIYPIINEKKCIHCGLCEKTCPSINRVEKKDPISCYAAISKNETIREKSTSGGIATTLYKYILKNNGIVYGVVFKENCNVEYTRITDEREIEKLQGSKYVHSYINDTFKMVKKDLLDKKRVLFIGTPCQIAGLKKYLIKDYDNLILIDIICHGVPSQKYLKEEVKRLVGTTKIDRVNFRNGNNYGLYVIKDNKIISSTPIESSPYSDAFMSGLSLRENCQNCIYAGEKRISDITIGDFWGLQEDSKYYSDRSKGVSTIIITTEKGLNFFDEVKDLFDYEKREYKEAVNGNTQLQHPIMNNEKSRIFKEKYIKSNFKKTYDKMTILKRLKRKIKKSIKKLINNEK